MEKIDLTFIFNPPSWLIWIPIFFALYAFGTNRATHRGWTWIRDRFASWNKRTAHARAIKLLERVETLLELRSDIPKLIVRSAKISSTIIVFRILSFVFMAFSLFFVATVAQLTVGKVSLTISSKAALILILWMSVLSSFFAENREQFLLDLEQPERDEKRIKRALILLGAAGLSEVEINELIGKQFAPLLPLLRPVETTSSTSIQQ